MLDSGPSGDTEIFEGDEANESMTLPKIRLKSAW